MLSCMSSQYKHKIARQSATLAQQLPKQEPQKQGKEDDWPAFPYTIRVRPYLELT